MKLIPNTLTFLALMMGLGALYVAALGHLEWAIYLLVLSGVFDKADGAAARLLNCESSFGARLDSYADAVNFGFVPAIIVFYWSGPHDGFAGLVTPVACLVYVTCAIARLIRFTRHRLTQPDNAKPPRFFTGVPTPAGAALALLPVMLYLETGLPAVRDSYLISAWMVLIGLLMISTLPAYKLALNGENRTVRRWQMLVTGAILLLSFIATLKTIIVLDIAYLVSVPLCYGLLRRSVKG
ncbi:MAG: CDP-alcohol phosphatidyltransferase family protein [Rhodospirillaceae bacterium]